MDYETDPRAAITTNGGEVHLRFNNGHDSVWVFYTRSAATAFRDETLARWDAVASGPSVKDDPEPSPPSFAGLEWLGV